MHAFNINKYSINVWYVTVSNLTTSEETGNRYILFDCQTWNESQPETFKLLPTNSLEPDRKTPSFVFTQKNHTVQLF